MENPPSTAFAPAERASQEELKRQSECIQALPLAKLFLDTAATMAMVINCNRQILFASRAFRDLMSICLMDEPETDANGQGGLRPGEALACIHANETQGGCGTTVFCRNCGVPRALLKAQEGVEDVQECRMLHRTKTGRIEALDLRVWSRPLDIGSERFVMFTVLDISNEKRRQALERIFFHDILNTAGGVHGLARLLADTTIDDQEIHRMAEVLCCSSGQLIEEIQAHRMLNAAERNDLVLNPAELELHGFVEQLISFFSAHDVVHGRSIRIAPTAVPVQVKTDALILRRVVLNLLKNAVEATEKGETVTVDIWRDEQSAYVAVHNVTVMSEEVQNQVFNRSFSTRGAGRGLGSYSARLLTERYLFGALGFKSGRDIGTVFTITLPLDWQGKVNP